MVKKKNVDDQKMLKNQNREEREFQDRHQERSPNIKTLTNFFAKYLGSQVLKNYHTSVNVQEVQEPAGLLSESH